ncbi:MAG: hypothetical protein ACJZ11_00975 [Candidatus Neomarinimicrobiota bacterium]
MKQKFISFYIFMIISFGNAFSQVTTEQIYYGASSLSMSASDVALPKDSWSLFVNAAGIARQQGLSLVASSQSHFNQDYLSHSLLGFQFKTSKYGAYGISVENFSVDYSGSSLSAETAIGFHQGIMLRSDRISSFSMGYGIKYYNIEYGSSAGPSGDGSDGIKLGSLSTFGFDISFLGSLADRIRVGAKALNINSPTLGDANNSTRLPQRSQIGIAYSPYDLVWTTVSFNKSVGHPTHFSSGLSYEIQKNIFLKTGMQTSPNRFSSGFEVYFKKIKIDYGFITHPVLPLSHQISIEVNR